MGGRHGGLELHSKLELDVAVCHRLVSVFHQGLDRLSYKKMAFVYIFVGAVCL